MKTKFNSLLADWQSTRDQIADTESALADAHKEHLETLEAASDTAKPTAAQLDTLARKTSLEAVLIRRKEKLEDAAEKLHAEAHQEVTSRAVELIEKLEVWKKEWLVARINSVFGVKDRAPEDITAIIAANRNLLANPEEIIAATALQSNLQGTLFTPTIPGSVGGWEHVEAAQEYLEKNAV